MNQPPAFQFYVDNFVQGTCDMEPAEVGVYMRLLCYQWSNGAIPSEKGRLSRVAGGEVSAHVLAKFQKGPDGMLRNARMERERAKQFQFRQKQAEFGKKGGRPRKGSLTKPFAVEKGLAKGSQSPPSPSPSPSPSPVTDLKSPEGEGTSLSAPVRREPIPKKRIEDIHLFYSEQMGGDVKLDYATERIWYEWFNAGHVEDDFKLVFKYVRDGIGTGERNRGALKLRNLLQPDKFGEDLLISRQALPGRQNGGKMPPKSIAEKDLDRMIR